MSRRVNKVLEKDLNARRRSHMAGESTHIRVGSWQGTEGCEVQLVGRAADLHGTVCTCCKLRTATSEAGAA